MLNHKRGGISLVSFEAKQKKEKIKLGGSLEKMLKYIYHSVWTVIHIPLSATYFATVQC